MVNSNEQIIDLHNLYPHKLNLCHRRKEVIEKNKRFIEILRMQNLRFQIIVIYLKEKIRFKRRKTLLLQRQLQL